MNDRSIQVELHRHMDCSIRPSTLLECLQKQGREAQSTSVEGFQKKFQLRTPQKDLTSVIAALVPFQWALSTPEALARVAFETVEDCYREGTRKVELRYSPNFVCDKSGLSWKEALESFQRGITAACEHYPEMQAGLICIAIRDTGPEEVAKVVEHYLNHLDDFIGMDLAADETLFPNPLFANAFSELRRRRAQGDPRIRVTAHSGETGGPESIWEAMEFFGATRIGHGISCIKDPKLMTHLANAQICLEMCPFSNWITQVIPNLRDHPLPKALRAGIPVCINTDDPGIFGNSMPQEIALCQSELGMTSDQIQECFSHASRASFLRK